MTSRAKRRDFIIDRLRDYEGTRRPPRTRSHQMSSPRSASKRRRKGVGDERPARYYWRVALKQYSYYDVRFNPRRTDDLKPEARWWIGKTFRAQAAWLIDRDAHAYAGQFALTPDRAATVASGPNCVGWMPEEDLEILGASTDQLSI